MLTMVLFALSGDSTLMESCTFLDIEYAVKPTLMGTISPRHDRVRIVFCDKWAYVKEGDRYMAIWERKQSVLAILNINLLGKPVRVIATNSPAAKYCIFDLLSGLLSISHEDKINIGRFGLDYVVKSPLSFQVRPTLNGTTQFLLQCDWIGDNSKSNVLGIQSMKIHRIDAIGGCVVSWKKVLEGSIKSFCPPISGMGPFKKIDYSTISLRHKDSSNS